MKRRVFPVLLAACMAASAIPVPVMAQDGTAQAVAQESKAEADGEGDAVVSGEGEAGSLKVQALSSSARSLDMSELEVLIAYAKPGDTIELKDKTYTLDRSLVIDKPLHIVGTEGTVIDGSNTTYPVYGEQGASA